MNTENKSNSPEEAQARKDEATRVVKRLATLVEEHRQAALPLGIELSDTDLSAVIAALRDHAGGGSGMPVPGARDAIHGHVLNRLFEELVDEPSNILYAKPNADGSKVAGYEAMDAAFWLECLALMENELCR